MIFSSPAPQFGQYCMAGDARRISAGVRRLPDLLTEADHLARDARHERIEADDVGAAIAARRERAARVDRRLREAICATSWRWSPRTRW